MIMNQDDARRYEWLRSRFGCGDMDFTTGEYRPFLPTGLLPFAKTLDASIDKAMGMTPTHEPLIPADVNYQPLTEEEMKAIDEIRSRVGGKKRVDLPAGMVVFDEPVFTVDEVAEVLSSNIQLDDGGPHVWLNDNRRLNVGLLIPTLEIKAELLRTKAGE